MPEFRIYSMRTRVILIKEQIVIQAICTDLECQDLSMLV